MDEQTEDRGALREGTEEAPADSAGRRAFILKLAKAAMVPAVVVGIAANASSALAGTY